MYWGDTYAEKAMMRMSGKIKEIYAEAAQDIDKKIQAHNQRFLKKDAEYRQKVADGNMTKAEYDSWKQGQVFTGKRWQSVRDDIEHQINAANHTATDIVNGERQAVFVQNVNYAQYTIDKDFQFGLSFNLYDSATVTRLIRDDPDMLPAVGQDEHKTDEWTRKLVSSAITQGVIQGESIPKISKRIAEKLGSSNEKSMTRIARTAMTSAQNAGRIEAMHNAQGMGIEVKKLWISTLDKRTRDAHRNLDGQVQNVDDPFTSDLGYIMFPGDPNAAPANVWRCRCTLGWEYPEYQRTNAVRAGRTYDEDGNPTGWEDVPEMTYRQWEQWKQTGQLPQRGLANTSSQNNQAENEEQQIAGNIRNVVQGKDMTGEWKRRQDEFSFEIEDVINAQGFDGLPRVVSQEEFEKAVSESGFIAQRAYSAPDKETLDAYRDQLYNGKWYVDCSVGGARHGQGMYGVADYSGVITSQMQSEMSAYANMYGTRPAYIETFTVTKNFKYVEEKEIRIRMAQYNSSLAKKSFRSSLDEVINNPEIVSKNIANYKKYYGVTMSESEMKTYMEGMQWIKQKKSYELPDSDVEKAAKKIAKKYKLKEHSLVESQFRTSNAYKESMKNSIDDVGSYASLVGYDGIQVSGRDEEDAPYVVILNRTKVIFKRDDK